MVKFISKLLAQIVLFVCVFANSIQAGSFYSSKGIGLVHNFVSGRSVGMGGVGLALTDPFTVNYLNPATLVAIPLTSISGNFLHEATDLKSSSQDAFISDTNVFGLQFVIPLKRNTIVMALGVNPYSSIEFTFSARDTIGEKSFNQIVSGDGGVNTAVLSLAINPLKNLYLGVTGLFYFGTLRNNWQVIFDSAQFLNTQDEVGQNFTAINFRFGLLYKILSGWNVGAVFSPAVTLDANKTITLHRIAAFSDFPDSDFKIPLAFGVGTSLNLHRKLLIGLDFYMQKWSDSENNSYVNDSKRIGFGIEYFANGSLRDSYFSRMAYRAGIQYRDLGLEAPLGEKVTEIFASVGLGLPIKWTAARIDFALEAGKRGSISKNPFKETIIRITGTVTVGERWFYRGGRR